MAIDFGPDRWEKLKETYMLWWEGKLGRPIVPVVLFGKDPGGRKPDAPLLSQATCLDLSIPARDVIDRVDYELSSRVYLGDSFPFLDLMVYGPGVAAGFLGAQMDNSTGRVWFSPREHLPVTEIHFEYDAGNRIFNRIKDICEEGMKRWQGQVLVGMPDLGGAFDILATFRTTEGLLVDLYDHPEEVKRLTWEIHELWHRYYHEINEILQPVNPGYSDWSSIYSDSPGYVSQCDFCYMLGPDMFEEFVKPELEATFKRLCHNVYHLDGVGQLNKLDSLLKIKELGVIQWIPGDGKPGTALWPEVHQKTRDAGKNIQLAEHTDSFGSLDTVVEQLGSSTGIQLMTILRHVSEEADICKQLARYGIE